MLPFLINLSRYLIRSRGHGCTDLGLVAARTYGWRALPYIGALAADCWQEHGDR